MSSLSPSDTRNRLLEAATDLFSRDGYDGTSTRSIGKRAEVNIATLAYHFGSKEGLYEAVLSQIYEELLALDPPEIKEDSAELRLKEATSSLFRFARQRQGLVRLLLMHILQHGSLPPSLREPINVRLLEMAAEWMQALDIPNLLSDRLALLSLNHLVSRFAVSRNEDLLPFLPPDTPVELAESAISEYLGNLAVQLLLGKPQGS